MRKQNLSVIHAALLLLLPASLQAQTVQPNTLTVSLSQAQVPAGEIVMAVGAEKTTLAEGASAPPTHPSITSLVQDFAQITRAFGAVHAIAPPTMTLINTAPSNPDAYADIPAAEAGELLAATLTDAQWQRLTSAQGLGSEDLTSDEQRVLFRALLPRGTVTVKPVPSFSDLDANPTPKDITTDLPNAHLRLGQTIQLYLPAQGRSNMNIVFLPIPHLPGAATRYELIGNTNPPQDARDGVPVRAEAANTPKKCELDETALALQTLIPVDGLKTVGDLIARVADKTHGEIYADPRYAARSLTFAPFPAGASAKALDLLHALAYCLTATYRKVGPAYVLTDDLIGVGTRRKVWSEFDKDVDALRQKAVADAGDHLAHAHSIAGLDTFGDQLALSPSEQKSAAQQNATSNFYGTSLSLSELTPSQQEAAQKISDQLAHPSEQDKGNGIGMLADLSGKITVTALPQIELLLPSLDGPIDLTLDLTAMFKPAQPVAATPEAPVNTAPLNTLLTAIPRRAVLAAPQTPEDLKSLIQSMQKLGLNQLWLPVIVLGDSPHTELLDLALRETKNTSITVYPVLNVLDWGPKTAPDLADLTILGQTSAQSAQRQAQRTAAKSDAALAKPAPALTVSLFAPSVQSSLSTLIHALSARPGVAGLIWRGTAPPGYDLPKQSLPWIDQADPLGYSLPARLAFLRQSHADPVDISDTDESRADTHLPLFDDAGLDTKLQAQWRSYRSDSDLAFLRALASSAGKTSIFIEQRRPWNTPVWMGSWDGPHAPLPANHQIWEDTDLGSTPPPAQSAVDQAKSQSRTALVMLSASTPLTQKALAAQIGKSVSGTRWDGFVLDLTAQPGDPLKALAEN